MQSTKKYLLWDFDNTIAYRDGMWKQTIYELLQENGFNKINSIEINNYLQTGFPWHSPEISHKEFFNGIAWWEFMNIYFTDIIKKIGIEEKLAIQIAHQIKSKYLDISKWHLYDDTIECLDKTIANGYENIILSNHIPELEELVYKLGLSKYFTKIYSSAIIGYEKPNIKIFEYVLSDIENKKNVTMVGDSYIADVQGALNSGINAILVRKSNDYNYKYHCENLNQIFVLLI